MEVKVCPYCDATTEAQGVITPLVLKIGGEHLGEYTCQCGYRGTIFLVNVKYQ